jgi:deoxyribodipyrimidine photo-lyase
VKNNPHPDGREPVLFWFRRDLRLEDNTGLHHAMQTGHPVQAVFIVDINITSELERNDARFSFIYSRLADLHEQLGHLGSSLLIQKGEPLKIWEKLIAEQRVHAVYTNTDYEPYARERDRKVRGFLKQKGIGFHTFKDQVIFHESEILKKDGHPYTVFTPYRNRWLEAFHSSPGVHPLPSPSGGFVPSSHRFPTLKDLGFTPSGLKVPPYDLARTEGYRLNRDYPARKGTTGLSPHLRFGTVGIRRLVTSLGPDTGTFLGELIWREFFMQVLYHYPDVVDQNFHRKYDGIKWLNREEDFQAWCSGKTGYPLVDAGMRELKQTGNMHNRVRMVCAGFLCKHLLVDWRWGEAYFASLLLDYELSSNNGNWQWAAGTGCDAAPYFRVFNPETQRKKFDPEQEYIRKWIPELGTPSYPQPIVGHRMARERAIGAYRRGTGRE